MKLLAILLFFVSFPITSQNDYSNLCSVSSLRSRADGTDLEKAEELFRKKDYRQAKILFENILKSNPNHYKSIEYLGDIAAHQQNWDQALKQYSILAAGFPKTANYQYKIGGALAMKAKAVSKLKALTLIDRMETALLNAAKLDPKHIEARWALVMLYIELPGIFGGSEKKAQAYANELMALSKVDGYLAKGYIDVYFGRFAKAEDHYAKAHQTGRSKMTFQKLYDLYLNKLKDMPKANKLKEQFEKQVKT